MYKYYSQYVYITFKVRTKGIQIRQKINFRVSTVVAHMSYHISPLAVEMMISVDK
jgi:hypothetical protein